MGFSNEAVGGTTLVRPAIKSPNFVHSSACWSVNQDGSAEFNNLTIRGTFNGTNYIINSSGAFFYNGTPALGNLVTSIANAAGTDAFGNAYPAGISNNDGSGNTATINTGGLTTQASGSNNLCSVANGIFALGNAGQPTFLDAEIQSQLTANAIEMLLTSGRNPTADNMAQLLLMGQKDNVATGAGTAMPGLKVTGQMFADTWHQLTAGNSWTGTINYKLVAENEVWLWSNNLNSPASAVNGVTIVTLPSGTFPALNYRPQSNMTFLVGQTVSGFGMRMTLATDGTLKSTGVTASAGIQLGNRVPLDM